MTPSGQRRRPTEEQQDVTPLLALALRQTAKGWEVEKSLSYTKLTIEEKWGETKMIRCDVIMPDSRKQRSEKKLRCFNALRRSRTNLTKAERRRSGSLKNRISHLYVHFSHLRPSLTLPIRTFRVIKGKEKKQIIFLYISVVVVLPSIQQKK